MYDFLTAGFTASSDVFQRGGIGSDRPLPPRDARRLHAAEGPRHPHARRCQVAAVGWRRSSAHRHGGGQAGRLARGNPGRHRRAARAHRARMPGARPALRAGLRRAEGHMARGFRRDSRSQYSGTLRHLRKRRLLALWRRHARPPQGQPSGARANRVATEAVVAGKTLEVAAKTCPELREQWNCGATSSSKFRGEP